MVGLLDVEHFHSAGAHIGDGADRTTAGDVLAVTVTGSLLSDRNIVSAESVLVSLLWSCQHRR